MNQLKTIIPTIITNHHHHHYYQKIIKIIKIIKIQKIIQIIHYSSIQLQNYQFNKNKNNCIIKQILLIRKIKLEKYF